MSIRRTAHPLKTRRIPKTDLTVSRIGYGCADLAGWERTPIDAEAKARVTRIIHTALENGVTLFDQADLYGFGKSETLLGQVLKELPGMRKDIVIQTKCGQVFPENWEFPQPTRPNLRGDHIVRSVEGSLKRLQTDYLDILLLHVPAALMDPEEVAQAFDDLHQAGKVRYFGVSNHNAAQIALLGKVVRQPIVVNQIHVGLAHCDALTDGFELALELLKGQWDWKRYVGLSGSGTIDYCRLNDIQLQAWSPLEPVIIKLPEDASEELRSAFRKLNELAEAKGTTAPALALAWLLRHPAGIIPFIGTTNPDHVAEDCSADRVALSDDEWYDLFAAWADIRPRAAA